MTAHTPDPRSLKDKEVLVLGLGSFGGGAGTARALAGLGAKVTVSDLREIAQLDEASAILADCENVDWHLGGHPPHLFKGQLVVVNPAVPRDSAVIELAKSANCVLTTEIDLAIAARPELRCMAITGTHGKSTCASIAAHLLKADGIPCLLAGNLGGSLLEQVLELPAETRLVLELSSFQTEKLSPPPGWPEVSILTCLGSDHLDRHHSIKQYWQAKKRLLRAQNHDSLCLFPSSGAGVEEWQAACRGIKKALDPESKEALELLPFAPFKESYRLPSLLAAVAGALQLGCNPGSIQRNLKSWPGLPHRMQELPSPNPNLRIIDNGVATHPEPTTAALKELEGDVVLLAGGYDKGLTLDALVEHAQKCKAIHLSGPGGTRVANHPMMNHSSVFLHANASSAFKAALDFAIRESEQSSISLLFSPSFSSFDEFRNFRDRAILFHEIAAKSTKLFSKGNIS